jgi:isopentenyl-diphosphate delta-isomerase
MVICISFIDANSRIIVDYILFLTVDVDGVMAPNVNEVDAVKYVDQAELKAMFEEPSKSTKHTCIEYILNKKMTENSFTPWFKLIVDKYLYGWWDQLLEQMTEGKVDAMRLGGRILTDRGLSGVNNRHEIIRMV